MDHVRKASALTSAGLKPATHFAKTLGINGQSNFSQLNKEMSVLGKFMNSSFTDTTAAGKN